VLVLTRKLKEALLIGDDITVTVLSIDGDRIRLGIEAPSNVRIVRRELLEEVEDANKMAAQSAFFLDQWRQVGKNLIAGGLENALAPVSKSGEDERNPSKSGGPDCHEKTPDGIQ